MQPLRRLVLSSTCALSLLASGCALFAGPAGGANKPQTAAQWKRDAKAQVAVSKPEQEEDMRTFVAQQNETTDAAVDKVVASTRALADVLLGKSPAFKGATPGRFDDHVIALRAHIEVPKLLPFEQRTLKHFFEPLSPEDTAAVGKVAGKPAAIAKLRAALEGVQGAGYSILLEHTRAVATNWGAELRTLYLGAKVVAFERAFETKASKETLDVVASMLATRAQTRELLALDTAMLAAFEGVSQGGDPKAITALAEAAATQLAVPRDPKQMDPRAFLDGLTGEGLDIAASLESNMRVAMGDKSYEHAYQRELVDTLQRIEEAEAQASIEDQIDAQARAVAIAQVRTLRDTAQQRLVDRAKAMGLEKAKALLGAMPYGAQLNAGMNALRELRAGNPRAALMSAADAAPPGPIGQGIKTALQLAFKVADVVKRRRATRR